MSASRSAAAWRDAPPSRSPVVTQPTRIRAQVTGDRTVVRMLLSHDMGWYDPASPGGGTPFGKLEKCEER